MCQPSMCYAYWYVIRWADVGQTTKTNWTRLIQQFLNIFFCCSDSTATLCASYTSSSHLLCMNVCYMRFSWINVDTIHNKEGWFIAWRVFTYRSAATQTSYLLFRAGDIRILKKIIHNFLPQIACHNNIPFRFRFWFEWTKLKVLSTVWLRDIQNRKLDCMWMETATRFDSRAPDEWMDSSRMNSLVLQNPSGGKSSARL